MPDFFYHGTTRDKLPKILKEGLKTSGKVIVRPIWLAFKRGIALRYGTELLRVAIKDNDKKYLKNKWLDPTPAGMVENLLGLQGCHKKRIVKEVMKAGYQVCYFKDIPRVQIRYLGHYELMEKID